jgi:hypothetical protein
LLPAENDRKKASHKKLKQAYDYLSQKRIEFEPVRNKLRAVTRVVPPPGEGANKKEIFIRTVVNYLVWTHDNFDLLPACRMVRRIE